MDGCRWLLFTFLLLLLLHQATCAGAGAEVTSAVGRSVTFQLPERGGEAAAWSFHGNVIVTVKFGDPPEAIFLDERYKPRWAFPERGRALSISRLTVGDAGTYTATVNTGVGVKTFTLRLYQELPVPTVTCAAQNCSADGCRYTLRCVASGSGSGNVSYRWSVGEWGRSEGPTVLVEEMPSDEEPLTCTAQNPVSSRNVTVVSPAALCAGTHSSTKAGIVAAVVVGALVAAVLLLIYCVSKGCRTFRVPAARATDAEAEAEGMTVYARVGPSQQVSLGSFPSAQHRDSKTPPIPDVEPSSSVYATVQAVAQTDDEKMGNGAPGCGERDEPNLYSSVS